MLDRYDIHDDLKHLNIESKVPVVCKLTYTKKSDIGKEIAFPFYKLSLYPDIDKNINLKISSLFWSGSESKKVFIDACEHSSFDIDEFKFVHFDPNSFCRKTLKYDKVVKTFNFKLIGCIEMRCKKFGDKPAEITMECSVSSIETEIIDLKIGE